MGLTLIDAGVLIGFMDSSDAHHEAARRELGEALGRSDRVVIPASAFAEALVAPARAGSAATAAMRDFSERLPLTIAELDAEIAVAAAQLRARHGAKLKLPDALVVATALHLVVDVLVTTDRGWPSRSSLGFAGHLRKL